jgi:hypothetical protein
MRGKYVTYTPERAAKVVELVARGVSLGAICRMEGAPSIGAFIRWRRARPALEAAYLEACEQSPGWRGPLWSGLPEEVTSARKAKKPKPGRGARPSGYTRALGEKICARIIAGASVGSLAADRRLPSTGTLYNWLETNAEFRGRYAAACEVRAELLADEAMALVEDAWRRAKSGPGGALDPDPGAIGWVRLKFAALRWRVARMSPGRYGLRGGGFRQ